MNVYYNDNNDYCCDWLKNLANHELIHKGTINNLSIEELRQKDLRNFDRVHLFAGIGGWELALNMAGWNAVHTWTISCPCQPYSNAGLLLGEADSRSLWNDAISLIPSRRLPIIFGEQVASKAGKVWIMGVRADLVKLGYIVAIANLPACSVSAPHVRQRLWFAAYPYRNGKPRSVNTKRSRITRPWGKNSTLDMQSLLQCPFDDGNSWPKPLIRTMVDGVPNWMEAIHAIGNSIVPQLAAEFILSSNEAIGELT